MHGLEIRKLPFWWTDLDFTGHLVLLNENERSVNMIKQARYVMTKLRKAGEMESPTYLPIFIVFIVFCHVLFVCMLL